MGNSIELQTIERLQMVEVKDMAIMQSDNRNLCNPYTLIKFYTLFIHSDRLTSIPPNIHIPSVSPLVLAFLSLFVYNIKNTMLGWMSRCWGGFGVNSQFQRARVRSIVTDWKVPDDQDLCILINSFKGQNPEIAYDTALDMFFTHMQIDDQKNNPIFLLKHLYILDQTVQERTALEKIATYYSSQFFAFKTGQNIQITPIRQLVATYFMYIKKKAEIYNQIDPGLFQKKQQRKKLIEKTSINDIFVLVDRCFQIQKQVSQINSKYKGRNKSAEMIQIIFTMLLKTYLFCYTNVSTCAAVLFKRLNELNKTEAIRMYKFIIYFNKDYTRNFVDFVQSNKEIPIYRNIKYSQIILIEKSYVQYLQNYIKGMDFSNIFPNVVNNQEEEIANLPEELASTLEDIKVAYQSRKEYRLIPKGNKEREFQDYKNLFSNDYETEYQTSVRNAYNAALQAAGLKPLSDSKLFKSKKKIQYENLSNSTRFTETTWNEWNNVYSS